MPSISRICAVSIHTAAKLLIDAGKFCADLHDREVRNGTARRVRCDEIWSFAGSRAKNVATAKAAPEGAGDTWTWTALDSDGKLIVAWLAGAQWSMQDLAAMMAAVAPKPGRRGRHPQTVSA